MITWTVGARITEQMFEPPTSAYVAMATAILVEVIVSAIAVVRLLRTVDRRVQEIREGAALTP